MSHGGTWIKLLLTILERKDESEVVLERAIAAIATIVSVSEGKSSLIRDVITPALPTYYSNLMNLASKPSLLRPVLYHIQAAMTLHPTTFRPFSAKLHHLCVGILNGSTVEIQTVELAARAFSSLYLCAPKNTAAEQWTIGFLSIIAESHQTLDFIFGAVVEERPSLPRPSISGFDMMPFSSDYASSISYAVRRLSAMFGTLSAFLGKPTDMVVQIPLGQLVELLHRVLDVGPRTSVNAKVDKVSQAALMAHLPTLHVLAILLMEVTVDSMSLNMLPHIDSFVTTLVSILLLPATTTNPELQERLFVILGLLFNRYGQLGYVEELNKCVAKALSVLESSIPTIEENIGKTASSNSIGAPNKTKNNKKRKHGTEGGADMISNPTSFHKIPSCTLFQACTTFLSSLLSNTYNFLTASTHRIVDATALQLLLNAQIPSPFQCALLDLILSSVTGPGSHDSAILTHAVRISQLKASSSRIDVAEKARQIIRVLECLVHPRLPGVRRKFKESQLDLGSDDESNQEIGSDLAIDRGEDAAITQQPATWVSSRPQPDEPMADLQALKNEADVETDERAEQVHLDSSITHGLPEAVLPEAQKPSGISYTTPLLPERELRLSPQLDATSNGSMSQMEEDTIIRDKAFIDTVLDQIGDPEDEDMESIPEINIESDTDEEDEDEPAEVK